MHVTGAVPRVETGVPDASRAGDHARVTARGVQPRAGRIATQRVLQDATAARATVRGSVRIPVRQRVPRHVIPGAETSVLALVKRLQVISKEGSLWVL